MRLLLDQECAAVAGGHESECERNVTVAAITTGAILGAASGGAIGALAGAGTGSLIAQVVAPSLCNWAEKQESEDQESDGDKGGPSGHPFRAPNVFDNGLGANSGAPLQLVVDTSSSDY